MADPRYVREREIGRGGMGTVWLGRDEVLGRRVAMKRVGLMPGASSPDVLRAEREAQIAAGLNHPHIINVYDLVEDDGEQWLVMEYIDGGTLADLIRHRGALPPAVVVPLLAQVASALATAHSNNIVHRDVKPSNVLVREDGEVKLTDFGIARGTADASLTQTGLVTGSPAYLSPEVASGRTATPASDVWSLGATLFHALAGKPPYDTGTNVLGALYRIVNEPPPRLSGVGDLEPILLATMAHDPNARWSMEQVATALARAGHRGAAGPTPEPTRTERTLPPPSSPPAPRQRESAEPEPTEPEPTRTLHAPPVATPTAARRSTAPSRRPPLVPILVSLIVLGLLGVIVFLALLDDPQDTGPTPQADTSSTTVTSSGPSTTTSAPAYTEAQLRGFIQDYLDTASSDPATAFTRLTPDFQAASRNYEQFWGSVRNPRLLEFSADVDDLVVDYTWRYNRKGRGVRTDRVSLQLQAIDGQLLIAAER